MMDERTSRVFFGLCMLVLVWIGVYWMWQPEKQRPPVIRFDEHESMESGRTPVVEPTEADEGSSVIDQVNRAGSVDVNGVNTSDTPRLIPPEFREHVVVAGERMQTIAQQYYGSIDDWRVIAMANPTVDPQKLREGMVLRIPLDPTNIQGRLEGDDTEPGVVRDHSGDGDGVIEYVVRPGDSLSVISQRIYGSSKHARFIFDANRDTLRSMDDISIGQLLRLPPLPED